MEAAELQQGSEAELSVLGGVLLDNSTVGEVAALIGAHHFISPRNRIVWGAMLELNDGGSAIDPVTLAIKLGADALDAVGGMPYLCDLNEASMSARNIKHHAGLMVRLEEKRALIRYCTGLLARACSASLDDGGGEGSEGYREIATEGALKLGQMVLPSAPEQAADIVDAGIVLLRELEAKHQAWLAGEPIPVPGYGCGLPDVDQRIHMLLPEHITLIAADTGHGKTAFAIFLAWWYATHYRHHVLYISVEVGAKDAALRVLTNLSGVENRVWESGMLSDGQVDHAIKAGNMLASNRDLVSVAYKPRATPGYVKLRIQHYLRRRESDPTLPPLGAVVIDYVQAMRSNEKTRGVLDRMEELASELEAMRADFPGVAWVWLAQLNSDLMKNGAQRAPKRTDVRYGPALCERASQIVFLDRPDKRGVEGATNDEAIFYVVKSRKGATGAIPVHMDGGLNRFEDTGRGWR